MANEQNIKPIATPDLADVMNVVKKDISRSINCVKIGKIGLFNPLTCTAEIEIMEKRKLLDGRVFDYPILSQCPVFVLSGGDSLVTMDISPGDFCLVLFNDRDLDAWWENGSAEIPNSTRAHSLSDGICLVGIRPLSDPFTLLPTPGMSSLTKPLTFSAPSLNFAATSGGVQMDGPGTAGLSGNGASLHGKAGHVTILNNATDLKTLIGNLVDTISGIISVNDGGGNYVVSPASQAALAAAKAQFNALLG